MATESTDIVSLLVGTDPTSLKQALKALDSNHELERALDGILKLCKKEGVDAQLQKEALPFLRKHLGTVPSSRAKTIAETLINYGTVQFSPKVAIPLLRSLVEVTQLTNAEKLRRIIKTDGQRLHNKLRENGCSKEADDVLVTILNVLLFELNLLDCPDASTEVVDTVWKGLTGAEPSAIYQLASFIIYTNIGDNVAAHTAEIHLCKFLSLDDEQFITFAEPFIHVPVALFQPAGLRIFLDKVLVYYIGHNKVAHFIDLLLSIPELRNARLPSIDVHIVSAVLRTVLELVSTHGKKRKAETDAKATPSEIGKLVDMIFHIRRETIDLSTDTELFQKVFALCADVFPSIVFTREMKATAFLDVLQAFADMIPSLSGPARGLIFAVLPFSLFIATSDDKLASLIKTYSKLFETLSSGVPVVWSGLFESPEVVSSVLSLLIKRCSRDCPRLRSACATLVSQFLGYDWIFVKAFVKEKPADGYKSLSAVFNKALRGKNPFPWTDTTICLQALVSVYEKESEDLRSSQFKPKKGLSFLLATTSQFISSVTNDATTLAGLIESSTTILIETAIVQMQTTRLAALVGVDVTEFGTTERTRALLDALFASSEVAVIADKQFFIVERLVDTVLKFGFHSGLSGYFTSADKLIKIAAIGDSEPLLGRLLNDLSADDLALIKTQVQSQYPLEKLSEDRLLRNSVFRLFYTISKQQSGESVLSGLEDYIFAIFCQNECMSAEAINFATAYLDVLKGGKYFGDFVAIALENISDLLASQKLYKNSAVITAELQRSLAAVAFLKRIFEMPLRVGVNTAQFSISGQLLAKLILNLTSIRQIIADLSEGKARRDPALADVLRLYDHFQKQLTNVCKRLVNPKEGSSAILTRQLPFVVSNCLTGEREPNLPTYLLLSGCDDAGISLLSATLPPIEKRRFAITFPNFVVQNKFTG
uniref:MMS19 nucleotide excision repair protein n=1 Tax=Panagrellus redivivus TaxID=6233 RepID=A0A7E4ZW83_PANRE